MQIRELLANRTWVTGQFYAQEYTESRLKRGDISSLSLLGGGILNITFTQMASAPLSDTNWQMIKVPVLSFAVDLYAPCRVMDGMVEIPTARQQCNYYLVSPDSPKLVDLKSLVG